MAKKAGDIAAKIVETKKNQASVEVTVIEKNSSSAYREALKHMAKEVTLKGFRKGKAPLNLVEKQLDPQKVLEHAISHLLPQILTAALKEHDLKPLSNPQIHLVEAKRDSAWKFRLEIPLQPEIDTKDFKDYIKGELAAGTIWTPDKGTKEETGKEPDQEEKFKKLLDALLKKYLFDVPPLMVEDEINRSLSRLLQQVETLGLKLEDYLKSIGKTAEQLRTEYYNAAEDNLRLEIILARLGQELEITVTDAEVDDMIRNAGDEAKQKKLTTPEQKRYIGEIIRKRKTIDALLSL